MIADGINRAVPTDKELRSCISWLLDKGFVKGDQNKYSLTESGRKLIGNAETKHDAVFKIWKYLEKDISKLV
jgi:predicted transcriptional regulator